MAAAATATTPATGKDASLPPPVDMSTIEQQKENIVPLPSGRSASLLSSLSSSSHSGLGHKLQLDHKRFQAQIDAVAVYEVDGKWDDGKDGLATADVAQLAEDPLDIHHQYARFILGNYLSGPSATSKLVPVLEASTRKFVRDERYRNDPRYLRMWNQYAKHVECPEDCYRFLMARGIGEKLAVLYEEYASVLEAANKRTEADSVYQLGISRGAIPLERLKRRYLEFQQRMMLAPPVSPPASSSSSSSTATSTAPVVRPILAGSSLPSHKENAALGTSSTPANNARAFTVFSDEGAAPSGDREGGYEDLGTVKSRTKENTQEAGAWKGETLKMGPMVGGVRNAAAAVGKLEIFRDEDATPATPAKTAHGESDAFKATSLRAPSESEQLAKNPFKNYSESELISSSSSTSKSKPSSSSANKSAAKDEPKKSTSEAVACDLAKVYPEGYGKGNPEYSFEELKARSREGKYLEEAQTWNGWEWCEKWDEEMERTERTMYEVDAETGWPILWDAITGAPLYDFLPKPTPPPSPSPAPPSPVRNEAPVSLIDFSSPTPSPQHPSVATSSSYSAAASPQPAAVLSFSPPGSPLPPTSAPLNDVDDYLPNPRRPPSPTINTRNAQLAIDDLFARTLKLDDTQYPSASDGSDDDSDDDDVRDPDTEDEDEEYAGVPARPSQYSQSTMGGPSQMTQDDDDAEFVPFSQTASQMGAESFYGGSQFASQGGSQFASQYGASQAGSQFASDYDPSQQSQVEVVQREPVSMMGMVYRDEENEVEAKPEPLRLFSDAQAQSENGEVEKKTPFRPTRPPLGFKPMRAFEVMRDDEEAGQVEEGDSYEEEQEFEEALRDEESQGMGDGFAMGRQAPGTNRFAHLIDHLTPITERTYEFTQAMTASSGLSASQRTRRDSAFPIDGAVEEEEEDDSEGEGEGEYEGDQAFVAYEGEDSDSDSESFKTRGSFSSDEDDEDEVDQEVPIHDQHLLRDLEMPPQQPVAIASADVSGESEWQDSTRKDAQYDDSMPSVGDDFNRSVSIPDGFTIDGNQSGMTTGMVVGETTNVSLSRLSGPPVIDPFSADTIASSLAMLNPPILEHGQVRDNTAMVSKKLPDLQKVAKKREAAAKAKGRDRQSIVEEAWIIELDEHVYSVREKLGEGSFGSVFRIALLPSDNLDLSFDAEDHADAVETAVKVEEPTNLWEFYILSQLQARLPARIRDSVVRPQRLYAYQDESFLLLDYCSQGTLLDAVNKGHEVGTAPQTPGAPQGLEEIVAMFFVIELLRVLEGFHDAGFIHGDLKIDNCLVRLEELRDQDWSSLYDPSGEGGWSSKGLKIIDFGRSIDKTLFPENQVFLSHLPTDTVDCLEMREDRTWTYEPDYYGVASIAFNLLFGRYIETKGVTGEDGVVRQVINQAFKRYHQTDLWTRLFDALLNPRMVREDGSLPITNELAVMRGEMEEWLSVNSDKNGKSLRAMIRKMELYALSKTK
ncbi:checkpoint serine/threonine-protein kinase [Pseudohyphozyma bogoriensis]|nr:checkpoint serine/threonine-protein kinase [Pseudohyphozyma bogoriensis]